MNTYIKQEISNVENLEEVDITSTLIGTVEVEIIDENQIICYDNDEQCDDYTELSERELLIKKMLIYIEELSKMQKQVAIIIPPSENEENCEIFGTEPLTNILLKNEEYITNNLTKAMEVPNLFKLPEIEPLPLRNMNQVQLRSLIPVLIKMSTGRNRVGYGNEKLKPEWWPEEAPWANVRSDVRPIEERKKLKCTNMLRQVVRSCYIYHEREDLLEKNDRLIFKKY